MKRLASLLVFLLVLSSIALAQEIDGSDEEGFPVVDSSEGFFPTIAKFLLSVLEAAVSIFWVLMGFIFDGIIWLGERIGLTAFQVQLLAAIIVGAFSVLKIKGVSNFIEHWSWIILALLIVLFLLTIFGVIK